MSEKIIDIREKVRAKIEEEKAKFQGQPRDRGDSGQSPKSSPGDAGGDSSQSSKSSQPAIFVTNEFLDKLSDKAMEALIATNDPPYLFARSNTIVKVETDEKGRPHIINLNDHQLRGYLARSVGFIKITSEGEIQKTSPPMDVVRDILGLGKWELPALEGIVQGPVLRQDGTILTTPGYDPLSRLYYVPPSDLNMPPIPENPTDAEVRRAINNFKEVFHDFPFIGESDRANALGLTITPVIRPAISGLVPLAGITARAPGTGKSLLAEIVSCIAAGKVAAMAGNPKDDDEMRKFITSRLLLGGPLIVFDNLDKPLGTASLARALTSNEWEDRYLGKSLIVRMPQRAVWIATGNNLRLTGDLPRRTYPIRLDARMGRPWQREGFKNRNLIGWVLQNRGELLAAILTIARAFILAGKPEPSKPVPVLGNFEAWATTVGGVLSFAGVNGFLENLQEFHNESDLGTHEWELFIGAWEEVIGSRAITCKEVERLLRNNPEFAAILPDELEDILNDPRKSFTKRLGRALAEKEKRPYGEKNLAFQRDGLEKRAVLWKLAPLNP